MSDFIDHIVFHRDLTEEEASRLRKHLDSHAGDAELHRRWQAFRHAVRDELDGIVGDRRVFALYALHTAGRGSDLTSEERRLAEEAARRLDEAVGEHPGLASLLEDVSSAVQEFDTMWEAWMGSAAPRPSDRRPAARIRRPIDRRPGARTHTGRWMSRTAFGLALVAIGFILLLVARRDQGIVTVTTAPGEIVVVDLGEGSRARLLGQSRLSYVPSDGASARQAELSGHAYFEIAKSANGFVVATATARATVVGTTFGVRADDEMTEVVLSDGRLALSSPAVPHQVVVLESGQMSRVAAAQAPLPPTAVSVSEQLFWTGLFIFTSTPLGDVLNQLSRHHGVVVSADASLLSEPVTGTFDQDQPLGDVLVILAAALDASYHVTEEGEHRLGR